ncbi:beta-1,3-galactosyltransferase brn [Trichonephila inaurata madagascariensis]|uniref:Hexosyltransferase n=1 Tax=Trichonephila inaurata madagascariensis TaxID=2747483 RepID=A0A8X6YWJ2_9ARAC|nr:beta-1,3-galactosyltransferase brn [Trichonephila inaurata madagascariensis]
MEKVLEALKNGYEPEYAPVNKLNYSYSITNNKKCSRRSYFGYEKVVILFVIKSALYNENRRNVIRQSWGMENRFSDVNIKRIFTLGISEDSDLQDKINGEYEKHKDLVQAEFIDSYYNNTIKTMMGFKWVVHNCPKAEFIMFADDDMYISTRNLLKFIRNPFNEKEKSRKKRSTFQTTERDLVFNKISSISTKTAWDSKNLTRRKLFQFNPFLNTFDDRLFAGYVFFSSPKRYRFSKWYVSLKEYPFSKYPPYVTAGAYILSYNALKDLYYTSMYTQNFKFDDVYLGIVAKKCGISPLHNEHFYFWRKPYSKESYSEVIASHGFDDPVELAKIWEEQKSLGHA